MTTRPSKITDKGNALEVSDTVRTKKPCLYRGTVMRQPTATLRGHFVLHGDRRFKSDLFGSDLVWCFVAVPLA
jgi:hypothetical protein